MIKDKKDIVDRLESRMGALQKERHSWMPHWRELSDYIQPRRGQSLLRNATGRSTTPGGKRNHLIYNNTATIAARTLTSAMMAGVVNEGSRWFNLRMTDEDLQQSDAVKQWLEWPTMAIYDSLAESNFYAVLPTVVEDVIIFGTAVFGQFENRETISRFTPFQIGEYFLANGEDGKASTIYRRYQETVENIVNMFGLENVSQGTKTAYENGNWDDRKVICHAIEPRSARHDAIKGKWRSAANQFDILSLYWEHKGHEKKLLKVSGFEEQAVHAWRWARTDPEAYGRSPGMDALGDIKMLQDYELDMAAAVKKLVAPPTQGPAILGGDEIDHRPGAHNVVKATSNDGIRPLYENYRPDVSWLSNDIQRCEERIKATFFSDAFVTQALDGRSQITAREIDERSDEKLSVFGPILTQMDGEALDPVIDRQFGLIVRGSEDLWPDRGIIPPPPEEIRGRPMRVDYVGPLQIAQMSAKVRSIQDFTRMVAELAANFPEAGDKLDAKAAVDAIAEASAIDPDVVNSDEIAEGMAQARAEAEQMAQTMAMMEQGANAVDKVLPAQ